MSQFIEMFGNVESKPLIEVCIKRGEYGSNVPADDYDGSIRYVRITDITEEGNLNNVIVSPRKIEEKYMLLPGDLLFARTGNTVGKTYLHKSGKMIFAGYLIRYRLNKELMLPQFVFAYTHTNQYYDWVDKTKKVGAQPNISAAQYDSMPIPVPQKDAQMKFVAIAEQADKSKFGDFKSQFIEMFGNVESYCKLEDLVSDTFPGEWGSEPASENAIKVIRTTNFTNEGHLDLADVVTRDIEPKKVARKKLKQGDTILERSGGTKDNPVGRVVFFDEIGDYLPNNFTQVLRPKESVNPVYLFYALYNSYNINKAAMRAMASQTTGIQNLSMSDFMAKSIVLPSRDEQNKFEQIYRQADKSKFGDFKSQFIEMFGNPLSLNQKNELKRLGECCILNPRRPNIALCDTDKVSFIPMSAISEEGYLADMTDEEYGKVKKGFTYFENNDVLFAKITPCMENGKGAIVHGLTNRIGMGSTEFHVLRPINGISSPYWLLALTRMPIFRERAAKNMSGTGGQKRVSASYLDHFMVGLPAIEEQRRFEAIYKQADKSKFELRKSIDAIDKVIRSLING